MSIFKEENTFASPASIDTIENPVIDIHLNIPAQNILNNCTTSEIDQNTSDTSDTSDTASGESDAANYSNVETDAESIEELEELTLGGLVKKFKLAFCFNTMVGFGGFIYGWDTGTISGYADMEDFKKTFGEFYEKFNSYEIFPPKLGLIISILYIGCAIGGYITYTFKENIGRRVGLLLTMIIFIIGIILQISSSHWIQFIVGRTVVGISVGILDALGPLVTLEISPVQSKGVMTKIYPTMIPFGMLLGYIATYATKLSFKDDRQWRVPLGLNFAWALIVIGGLYYLPESPKYLIKKGKTTQAKQSIAIIIGKPEYDELVSQEFESFHEEVAEQNEAGEATWNEIYTGEQFQYVRFLIGVFLLSFQQLTGHTLFLYYTTALFGITGNSIGYVLSILFGGIYLFSTLISHLTIRKFSGRRNLIYGAASLAVCLFALSVGSSTILFSDTTEETSACLLVLIFIFISLFATTWGPGVAYTTLQNQPLNIRNKSYFVGSLAGWGFAFLTTFFAPTGFLLFQFSYGYFFTFFNIVAAFFVYFMVPETFELSLQQVETLYQSYTPWSASATLTIAEDKKRIEIIKATPGIDHHERNKFIAPNYDV